MSNPSSGPFVDADLLPPVPGLDPPTVQPRTYTVDDQDQQQCRTVAAAEFDASYVDNNIATFQLAGVNWLTLDVDDQQVILTYTSGAQVQLLLGSISLEGGAPTDRYTKTQGIIYPTDEAGALLLNAVNTPNLAAIRTWYLQEAKRVNDQRIQIAEVVHVFTDMIGGLAHTGDVDVH